MPIPLTQAEADRQAIIESIAAQAGSQVIPNADAIDEAETLYDGDVFQGTYGVYAKDDPELATLIAAAESFGLAVPTVGGRSIITIDPSA